MQMIEIEVDRLRPHPRNSNVMAAPLLEKLTEHIRRSGRYPPIVARPIDGGAYQILDGHHRVAALRTLAHRTARCVVWEVDEDEALLLLATLNRLEGQDDPRKRATLVRELSQRSEWKQLARQLPERSEHLKKLLALDRPTTSPRPPQPSGEMVQAVYFFLRPTERSALKRRLKVIGGSRESALMTLVGEPDEATQAKE